MTTKMSDELSKAYGLIHPNKLWRFELSRGYGGGTVTANFESASEQYDGTVLLTGKLVDDYGWWHRSFRIGLLDLPADLERGTSPAPDPEPFPVAVGFEWRHGMLRLRMPDESARRLKVWTNEHWTEIPGVAAGYTSCPKRGSWAHRALAYLHSVQSHTSDDGPFIEGDSFAANRRDQSLLVGTCGVSTGRTVHVGFHISG